MRSNFRNTFVAGFGASLILALSVVLGGCLAEDELTKATATEGPSSGDSSPDAGARPKSPGSPGTGGEPAPPPRTSDGGSGGEGPEPGGDSRRPDAGVSPAPGPRTPGYLHTRGADIVDSNEAPVRITGINWFGMETNTYAPHGLWTRSLGSMLDQIKALGYNTIRLPYTNQLFDPGSTPNSIDFNQNPELAGKSGLEIMDIVVREAGARGLKIFLDRHRPDANGQSELWYTPQYSEARWIADWRMLASRYKGNTTVVGCDLHNEPHGPATWGDGNLATDWQLAAERAGNAILDVNPELLIIVEGVERANDVGYWWGGNLRGVAQHPVVLQVSNQLVYSPHEYPASLYAQTWFSDPSYPNNLEGVWRETFGYIAESGQAPVLIGEFGTRYQTEVDKAWLHNLATYISSRRLSFSFWALNPDSGDTGGILADDWSTVLMEKQTVITPTLAPLLR